MLSIVHSTADAVTRFLTLRQEAQAFAVTSLSHHLDNLVDELLAGPLLLEERDDLVAEIEETRQLLQVMRQIQAGKEVDAPVILDESTLPF